MGAWVCVSRRGRVGKVTVSLLEELELREAATKEQVAELRLQVAELSEQSPTSPKRNRALVLNSSNGVRKPPP